MADCNLFNLYYTFNFLFVVIDLSDIDLTKA